MEYQSFEKSLTFDLKKISIFSFLLIIVSVVFTILSVTTWVLAPVILFQVLILNGFLISVILGIESDSKLELFLYSIGLGLSFVMLGGLSINWLLPFFVNIQPLSNLSLLVFFNISILLFLLFLNYFKRGYKITFNYGGLSIRDVFLCIVPFIFVIQSIVGVGILNNNGGNLLTLIMLFSIALYVSIIICLKKPVRVSVYISALFGISLSLLLMYSMRSGHIIGWDIHEEYQVFNTTLKNLEWKMSSYPGLDYNACLSITILPTILKVLTNISSEYVFKFLFQIFFALTPLITFSIARKYYGEKLAFMSSFLVISQSWFYEQMPALIRQEIAFIFYLLLVMVLFDKKMKNRTRSMLLILFSIILVVSHYSTSYIWFALIFGTFVLSYILKYFFKNILERSNILTPLLLLPIIFLFLWEVPITHTGDAINNFTKHIEVGASDQILKKENSLDSFDNSKDEPVKTIEISNDVINTPSIPSPISIVSLKNIFSKVFFKENIINTDQNMIFAHQKTIYKYRDELKRMYSDDEAINFKPKVVDDRVYVNQIIPDFIAVIIGFLSKFSKFIFFGLFTFVGMLTVFIALIRKESREYQDLFIFNIVAFVLVVLMIATPYLQAYYNLTRLFLHMFFTLSIFSVVGAVNMTKYFLKKQMIILSLILSMIFLSYSGAFDQITGGQARITLGLPPAIYDVYYVYDTDVAGAKWLSNYRDSNIPVQSDIIANLRLQSFGDINADIISVFPQTILKEGYVYLINLNILPGNAYFQFTNNTLIYEYPLDFLNNHKSLIYNNGGSRVYR